MSHKTRTALLALGASVALLSPFTSVAHAADAKAVEIDTSAHPLDSPLFVTGAPGEPNLLFVVEQTGKIRVLDNEVIEADPFLDLSSLISCCDERGVLSMAFPPDYQTSRLFYVVFTNPTGDVELDEFKRSSGNPKRASLSTRRKLLAVRHRDAGNHNGGQLQFGPDNFLYMSIGDGGELIPRGWPAPDLNDLRGKILRIDPHKTASAPYTIPSDNPFIGEGKPEIFSYGLRNPWRFSFDGNKIIIADVGQYTWEEINYLTVKKAKGANFGWPDWEGKKPFDSPDVPPGADPPTFPMLYYSHSQGCSVIGGYVSHDPTIPALNGRYLYGDLCGGKIFSLTPDFAANTADKTFTGIFTTSLTSFGKGPAPANKLYFTQGGGGLFRIDAPGP